MASILSGITTRHQPDAINGKRWRVLLIALSVVMALSPAVAVATPGGLDDTFAPDVNSYVYSVAVQDDGKILIGGDFTAVGGVARNKVARLNADGTLDDTFAPDVNNYVYSFGVQDDGKILIGGVFDTVGGETRNYLARLNADGTLDDTFAAPNVNDYIYSVVVQDDGKILIGGIFDTVGGETRNYLARLLGTTTTTTTTVASPTTTAPVGSLPETGRDMSRVGVVGLLCAVTGMVFLWRRRVNL